MEPNLCLTCRTIIADPHRKLCEACLRREVGLAKPAEPHEHTNMEMAMLMLISLGYQNSPTLPIYDDARSELLQLVREWGRS